jgi:cell division protein FtsA
VRECQVKIEGIAVNSLASAQVVLDQKQKEAGALVIDIGGGVTDFITCLDGAVHHSGVLAVGGDHINSDISSRFRIPASRAEKIKIEEGSAILGHSGEGEKIVIKNDTGFAGMQIGREELDYVIHVRFEEIFHLVKKQVYGAVPEHLIGAGVMLTGGCSLTRGIRELAESVFEIPVRLTMAKAVSGPTSAFENPRFSTAIGLVKYAQAFRAEMSDETAFERVARWVSGWFQKPD